MVTKANTANYNEKSMKTYEGVDAVRKRSGMFVGLGNAARHHLVYEILTNSVDEALGGYCDKIDVVLYKDGSLSIADNGRGIPWKKVAVKDKKGVSEKVPACILAATSLHSGGKFDTKAYKVSAGTNGVGLTCVNALSDHFRLDVWRDEAHYYFECSKGKLTKKLTKIKETVSKKKTGTKITFLLDTSTEALKDTEWNEDQLRKMIKLAAYLNKGLTLTFTIEGSKKEVFLFPNGLKDFVNEEMSVTCKKEKGKRILPDEEPFYFAGEYEKDGVSVDVEFALDYNDTDVENTNCFVNGIRTPQGGTHLTGFRLALSSTITKYIKESNLIGNAKKDQDLKITGDDCREGLVSAISVNLETPQFHGQTKDELGNREAQGATQSLLNTYLKELFETKPKIAKSVCNRVIAAARGRLAAKKAREVTRKSTLDNHTALSAKLKDCLSRNPEECELFIVEGNSAGGSAKNGRNKQNQAILALKGKILNTYLSSTDILFKNNEVQSLISSIGVGVGNDIDLEKLRYHKIIILADADVDGSHISCLILTFFYRHMLPLITNGYVYIALSPLYRVFKGNKLIVELHTEEDREEWILDQISEIYEIDEETTLQDIDEEVVAEVLKPYHINYIKGLGELDPDQLGKSTLDPKNRKLIKVNIDDAEYAEQTFKILMHKDEVDERKKFISENAEYASLDI
jgi:DNA gyrase subunit B